MLALDRVQGGVMAKFKITVSEHPRSEREVEAQGTVMQVAKHTPEEFRTVPEELAGAAPLLPLGTDPSEDAAQQQ
jgi:hypothetical protein